MFSFLRGSLADKTPTQAVLDVGGVGYELHIPVSTYAALPEPGQTVTLLTHVQIREDAHLIFGFFTQDERNLFRLLLTVSDIGPKKALTVLSGLEPSDLKRAIINEDLAAITAIPGIGKKIAERLIIELREKVVVEEKSSVKKGAKPSAEEGLARDTVSVLVSLGYKKQEAEEAVKKALSSSEGRKVSVEELVRHSLKMI